MIGTVMGAAVITATRRSVILSAEGSDDRLTFDCTNDEAASVAASPVSANAPAALRPSVLKNERRSTTFGVSSSSFCAAAFIFDPPPSDSDHERTQRQPLPRSNRRTENGRNQEQEVADDVGGG